MYTNSRYGEGGGGDGGREDERVDMTKLMILINPKIY